MAWYSVAVILDGGLSTLPVGCIWAIVAGSTFGATIPLLKAFVLPQPEPDTEKPNGMAGGGGDEYSAAADPRDGDGDDADPMHLKERPSPRQACLARFRDCLPVVLAFAIAFMVPPFYSCAMCLGSGVTALWKRRDRAGETSLGYAVASGMMAGEGVMGVACAAFELAGFGQYVIRWGCLNDANC